MDAFERYGVFEGDLGEVVFQVEQIGHERGGEAYFHHPLVPAIFSRGNPGRLNGDVAVHIVDVDFPLAEPAGHFGDFPVQPAAIVGDTDEMGQVGDSYPIALEILVSRLDFRHEPKKDALLLQRQTVFGLNKLVVLDHNGRFVRHGT